MYNYDKIISAVDNFFEQWNSISEMKLDNFIIQGFGLLSSSLLLYSLWTVNQDAWCNGYRHWFPKLLCDNHLEVAGSILTAGKWQYLTSITLVPSYD